MGFLDFLHRRQHKDLYRRIARLERALPPLRRWKAKPAKARIESVTFTTLESNPRVTVARVSVKTGDRTFFKSGTATRNPTDPQTQEGDRFARKLALYRAVGWRLGDFYWPWRCIETFARRDLPRCGRGGDLYSQTRECRRAGHQVVANKERSG